MEPLERCKTCRWWGKNPDADADGFFGEGDIELIESAAGQMPGGEGHKPCTNPKLSWGSYDGAARDADGLNTYEVVGTGPEFGCIHHRPATA